MKKVRFESPKKSVFWRMDESECHSPRPYIERKDPAQPPDICEYKKVVYSNDPVHRFEYSDCSPYPLVKKSVVPSACEANPDFLPSKELNLSMLDIHEPRHPYKPSSIQTPIDNANHTKEHLFPQPKELTSIENMVTPPNVLRKDDNFFIRRGNLNNYNIYENSIGKELRTLRFDKENDPLAKKKEMMKTANLKVPSQENEYHQQPAVLNTVSSNDCNCHHCQPKNVPQCKLYAPTTKPLQEVPTQTTVNAAPCFCKPQMKTCFHCETYVQRLQNTCHCSERHSISPQNAVDKKTWAIQKLEQSRKVECMDVEKQSNITKEKREPTITDLLKIIKLQNEQLQLLHEKVDNFITTNNKRQQIPAQNYMTEHVALQKIDTEHKISIGVMTSFEMVRTSTVINKELLKPNDNAQIQCNMSKISIKEVAKQPGHLNFLDGIAPVEKTHSPDLTPDSGQLSIISNQPHQQINGNEEKTLNEMSLYNVQVDNAITPMMSPEQSMYLDVRDYSDSDSVCSDEQSNVGWTYYNKVMTHVNGMLQDSEMPSSASALYRNTRQQCVQMQIDKTNVSVTKRVKFGDDPIGVHQKHVYPGGTDTSLKMNQLAAKYLKQAPAPAPRPLPNPGDISFATRNYMERHKILQGLPTRHQGSPQAGDIPRFLDITALKQQPKLL